MLVVHRVGVVSSVQLGPRIQPRVRLYSREPKYQRDGVTPDTLNSTRASGVSVPGSAARVEPHRAPPPPNSAPAPSNLLAVDSPILLVRAVASTPVGSQSGPSAVPRAGIMRGAPVFDIA